MFKCVTPNSPDHLTVLNALTDENDNWSMSMSVCARVLNLYSDLLLSNSLQVNNIKLVGEEFYHLWKGSKAVQISPIDIGLACYNELHMDINMSSVFVQLCQSIMTVCQKGQIVLSLLQKMKLC